MASYLLDTHTFLWMADSSDRLGSNALSLILDPNNELILSIASVWEIAIKVSLTNSKLYLPEPFDVFIPNQLALKSLRLLNFKIAHTNIVATLPFHHRDPFDRMLIAQAMVEGVPIISVDSLFDTYSVTRLW